MSFNELGLSASLLQAVHDTGYTTPTPIQQRAIPAILSGQDVMAAAQTGTGKTAGFTLPLLQRLGGKPPARNQQIRALVLTPTRELAAQVQEAIVVYGKHEKLRTVVVFGGVGINPQIDALQRGCDILVATPGRLLDLHQQKAVSFSDLEILVLDEADRMLDMGFIRDIRKILQLLPKQRQNLMFSATFSDEIRTLAKTICHSPLEIDVAPRNSTVETVEQQVYEVQKDKKLPLLGKLLQETREQVLVFSRTKHGANALVKKLAGFGVDAAAIHGNKSQNQRTKALDDFKNNRVQVLVATDIAARGLDIELLAMVINYDMPQVPEDYVHRIGRTGRAGASGLAVSLVCDEDSDQLRAIERLIRRKINRMSFDAQSLPAPKAVQEPARSSEQSASGQHGRQRPARPRHPGGQQPPRSSSGQPQPGQRQARQDNGGQRSAPAYPRPDNIGQRPAQQPPRQHSSRQPDMRQHGAGFGANASSSPQPGGRSLQGAGQGGRRRGRGHGGGRPQTGGSANPGNELRQGPAPGNRAPRPQAAAEQQPKRPVSGNREGASFGLPAKAASDSLWRSLGDRLRQGKLFRR